MAEFKGLIDKPFYVGHIKNMDKMVTELSPFMREDEIDKCIGFMHTLTDTKYDINPSPDDCKTQLQIMLGKDRMLELTQEWGKKNQKFLSVFGELKYKDKSTGIIYDGLDPEDNPEDYEKLYI